MTDHAIRAKVYLEACKLVHREDECAALAERSQIIEDARCVQVLCDVAYSTHSTLSAGAYDG